jgi:hypothetical protein
MAPSNPSKDTIEEHMMHGILPRFTKMARKISNGREQLT